mmetsp:Transcript_33749/g.24780  ORF Transcript_33749/g.24780 Transcript_33749/m.24780 type:complete len:116 (-) Transcript_33749:1744-2091(-)
MRYEMFRGLENLRAKTIQKTKKGKKTSSSKRQAEEKQKSEKKLAIKNSKSRDLEKVGNRLEKFERGDSFDIMTSKNDSLSFSDFNQFSVNLEQTKPSSFLRMQKRQSSIYGEEPS